MSVALWLERGGEGRSTRMWDEIWIAGSVV